MDKAERIEASKYACGERRAVVVTVLAEMALRERMPEKAAGKQLVGANANVAKGDLIFLRDRASLSTEGERR